MTAVCKRKAADAAWLLHVRQAYEGVLRGQYSPRLVMPEPEPEPVAPVPELVIIRTSPVLVAAQVLAPRHPALRSRKEKP